MQPSATISLQLLAPTFFQIELRIFINQISNFRLHLLGECRKSQR